MTFLESVGLNMRYKQQFGTQCDPIKYDIEDDPEVVFIGLIAQCCLEAGKPYEEMKIADVNDWLIRHGSEAVALEHWQPQSHH